MVEVDSLPSLEEQREDLRSAVLEAPRRHRILFVGRFAQGPTDVVASLLRALENLGHTVFHIDTSRHRDVLDSSSGARGGYGPIFLKVDALRAALERFNPDILIACAGGIVLNDAGAAELHMRGITSVGMTLSDPDVQPSVMAHVHRFDFHTTNSLLAYRRYVEAGLDNTLLMPFGIDRDFILRDVAPDPTLRADAICIGHAPGRTERHEVMLELARHVDVRVYGTGWPLPGAAPVKGDRLLQAAHAATFHVNFPATRAGFTNVKCGVFETVGAGAVLCTTEFDEMSALFDYGTEIIAYQSGSDLAETLKTLLQQPERIEEMRRRSFARLVSDHLYERRWLTLFASMEAQLTVRSSPPDADDRVTAARKRLMQSRPLPRTVLLSGYFGARNVGDDILLDALAEGIRTRVSDAHVVAAAVSPTAVERDHGLPAFRRSQAFEAEPWASRATAVVLGPGGLWHDYTIGDAGGVAGIVTGARLSPAHLVQLPLMVAAHGGAFHVFGMGVGPLEHPAARAAVRLSGRLAESVVVRDSASVGLLKGIEGWETDVEQAPDLAYALDLPHMAESSTGSESEADPYIVVNVRPWDSAVGDDVLRTTLSEFARRHELRIVGLPMQPQDEMALSTLFAGLADDVAHELLPADSSVAGLLSVLSGAKAVVSMRLHANLLAHRLGRPAVGIAYDPKLVAHFTELAREQYVLPMPLESADLSAALEAALTEQHLPDTVMKRIASLEEQVHSALDALGRRIESAPVRRPVAGLLSQAAVSQEAPLPDGWKVDQVVSLASGTKATGSLSDAAREVPGRISLRREGARIQLEESAPRRGDYVAWSAELATPDAGIRVEMHVRSRYPERPRRDGRIAYEVLVDDKVLFRQDVATWSARNTIWIVRPQSGEPLRLQVRVVALKHCEDWNWGRAAAVTLEALRQEPYDGVAELAWGASSPTLEPVSVASTASGANSTSPQAGASPERLSRRIKLRTARGEVLTRSGIAALMRRVGRAVPWLR